MKRPVGFYIEGFKLRGGVYTPEGLASGETRGASSCATATPG